VVIKALPASSAQSQSEVGIFSYLTSPLLRFSPRNHTLPLLEVLGPEEDWLFIVMPAWRMSVLGFLMWEVDNYFEFICQTLEVRVRVAWSTVMMLILNFHEGLAFMHENGIAHRVSAPYTECP